MLYEMITGTPPFTGATPLNVLTEHLTGVLLPPSSRCPAGRVTPALEAVTMRALARDRDDRYPSASALAAAIMQARAAPDDVHPARAGERATSRSGASTPPVMPATRDASGRVWILLWVLAGLASIAVGVYFALR